MQALKEAGERAVRAATASTTRMAVSCLVVLLFAHAIVLPLWREANGLPHVLAGVSRDSDRYIHGADQFFRGGLTVHEVLNLTYIVVLGGVRTLGLGNVAMVFVQLAATLAAGVALIDLGRRSFGPTAGLVAALVFLVNPLAANHRHLILPDALFVAFVVLVAWAAHRVAERGSRGVPALAGACTVVAFLRPNGIVVVLGAFAFVIASRYRSRPKVAAAVIGVAVLAFGATVGSSRQFVTVDNGYNVAEALRDGVVVAHAYPVNEQGTRVSPRSPAITDFDHVEVSMPATDATGSRFADALAYGARHPIAAAKLVGARIGIELMQVRPYYSARFNVIVGTCLASFLGLAGVGLWHRRRSRLAALALAIVVPQLLVIGIVTADRDGRYAYWALPLLGLFLLDGARVLQHRLRVFAGGR